MTMDLREEAAREILRKIGFSAEGIEVKIARGDALWVNALRDADTALSVIQSRMMEPTEEMWQAWRSVNCKTDGEFTYFSGDYGNWLACHQAMMSAVTGVIQSRAKGQPGMDGLIAALQFYARHEHWMAHTDEADSLRRILVAMKGDGEQHGWLVAETALATRSTPSNPGEWQDELFTEAQWTEEDGSVLWWKFPIAEPPYLGSPLCLGQTVEVELNTFRESKTLRADVGGWPGYHTHWTRIRTPEPPIPVTEGEGS